VNKPHHQRTGRLQAAIAPYGPDQRFERVGEDGRTLGTAPAGLALAQTQQGGQAQVQGEAVQGRLAHEVGADAGEVAFGRIGVPLEEQIRHGEVEHGVTEELQALVVVGAEAAVRQRAAQQRGVGEAVAQAALKRVESGVHGREITSNGPRT